MSKCIGDTPGTMLMNNLLDLSIEENQRFLASVLCVLCESSPITLDLNDIKAYWDGEIGRLQYDLVANDDAKQGSITFSLKDKV